MFVSLSVCSWLLHAAAAAAAIIIILILIDVSVWFILHYCIDVWCGVILLLL